MAIHHPTTPLHRYHINAAVSELVIVDCFDHIRLIGRTVVEIIAAEIIAAVSARRGVLSRKKAQSCKGQPPL